MSTTEAKPETNEQYHADKGSQSATMIKDLDTSPRLYEAKHILRTWPETFARHFDLGSAVHCAALEPQEFDIRYVACPKECGDRRTKRYKEWAASINPMMTVLSYADAEIVKRCVEAMQSNEIARQALAAPGRVESSYRWHCSETEAPCKIRCDKILPVARTVIDIKTTSSEATKRMFQKSVVDFRYYLQAAHYLSGAQDSVNDLGADWRFIFIVVETSGLFRCKCYELDRDALTFGFERRFELLREWQRRTEANDWSEENENTIEELALPAWLYRMQGSSCRYQAGATSHPQSTTTKGKHNG